MAPPNLVVAPVKVYILSCPPISYKDSNFCDVIVPFPPTPPIFTLQIFLDSPFCRLNFYVFGSFLFTFFNLIFFIPAGWPNVFLASLNCNTLQHPAKHYNRDVCLSVEWTSQVSHETSTETHCYILLHTATHRNTLQRTATRCSTLKHTATHCNRDGRVDESGHTYQTSTERNWNTMEHTRTHWNTLEHTATHCNTLQHTARQCNTLQ